MKEHFSLVGGAFLALLLFWLLLIGPPQSVPEPDLSRPTSVERGPHGYRLLAEWLRESGVPVQSLRQRFGGLLQPDELAETRGNLLIVTLPMRVAARPGELEQLEHWVRGGNTLLVLAALDENPEFWPAGAPFIHEEVARLTGLAPRDLRPLETPAARAEALEPGAAHPLFAGVERVVACAPGQPLYPHDVASPGHALLFRLGADGGAGQLWMRSAGLGQMLLSSCASVASNALLAEADNAVLLANVVRHALGEGGQVIFDDMHQGLHELYDPDAFFRDRRLHLSLLMLVGLWLLWLLTVAGFPAAVVAFRADEGESVNAAARFLARTLGPAQASRRLYQHFFALRTGLPVGHPEAGRRCWQQLAGSPLANRRVVARLRVMHDDLEAGRSVSPLRVQRWIHKLEDDIG